MSGGRRRFVAAGVLAIVLASADASAQAPPVVDLKGTWTGSIEVILEGSSTHHPGNADSKPAGKYRLRTQLLTLKIDGQEGRRFWGTTSSEHAADQRVIGSVSPDGKWIYMSGTKDLGDGNLVGNDSLEMCFREVTPASAMVGCVVFARQK